LSFDRVSKSDFALRRSKPSFAGNRRGNFLFVLAALCLLAPQFVRAQETESAMAANTPLVTETAAANAAADPLRPAKQPVESELIVEGMASYGNYRIFASGTDCKLYTGGLEYDRHSWGNFLKARLDYVGEVLPLVILNEPVKADIWGNPMSYNHKLVPGFEFSPIGFRMMWRNKTAIEPYLTAKGGLIAFPVKVISTEATYVNFSLQSGFGVQARLTDRFGLRLGLWNDFHFSNGFMVPVNPGLDVMNANLGLSYHFQK
jgi:hypothetical protein